MLLRYPLLRKFTFFGLLSARAALGGCPALPCLPRRGLHLLFFDLVTWEVNWKRTGKAGSSFSLCGHGGATLLLPSLLTFLFYLATLSLNGKNDFSGDFEQVLVTSVG